MSDPAPLAEPSGAAPAPVDHAPVEGHAGLSKRGWVLLGLCLLALAAAFAVVSSRYQAEGGSRVSGTPVPITTGIVADLAPVAFDPRTNQLTVRFVFSATGEQLLQPESGRLARDVRVTVFSSEGSTDFTYLVGSSLGRQSVVIGSSGQEADYPFDTYTADIGVEASEIERRDGGGIVVVRDLPVSMSASGGIANWNTSIDLPAQAWRPAFIGLSRVFSTKLFALVILGFMLALAAMSLWIALLAVSGRRTFETALLAWAASLLFALPMLRSNLPGNPPIGESIDVYLYFWLLLGAMLAAGLLALRWVRTHHPG